MSLSLGLGLHAFYNMQNACNPKPIYHGLGVIFFILFCAPFYTF
jgi:hypothetical protein